MSENLVVVGTAIIIIGFVVLVAGLLSQAKFGGSKIEGGGIVFIGPFPIFGGATSRETFYIILAVSVVLMIVFIMFNRNF